MIKSLEVKTLRYILKFKEILDQRDRIKLVLLLILMFIGSLLEALGIGMLAGFVSIIVDPTIILENNFVKTIFAIFEIKTSQNILFYGGVSLIVVYILKNLYLIGYKYLETKFAYGRYRSISRRLFNLYMYVPYSFHLRRNSAELVRNVTVETKTIVRSVLIPMLRIMAEVLVTISILGLLLVSQPVITLITIVFLGGASILILKFIKNKMHKYGKMALEVRGEMIQIVNEGLGGFKDAKITSRENWFVDRFTDTVKSLSKAEIFRQVSKDSAKPIIESIAITGMLTITLILLGKGYSVASLASVLSLFALSLQKLLPSINQIIGEFNSLRYEMYSLDPVYNDLISLQKYELEEKEKNGKIGKLSFKKEIEVKDVSFSYSGELDLVLKDISFKIPKGFVAGIVGGTGSGKTTLIDLILGLLEPTKGEIRVDGKNIGNNLRSWQRSIGYIPQFIYLSDDTIRNNIAFGIKEEDIDENKVKKAMQIAQMSEFVETLPKKLDTVIGEQGVRLSGGQRQRIGIARALYNDPEILIMDEATSSLDNITEKELLQAIEKITELKTMIVIAHRLTTVRNCDIIYIIEKGKITGSGKYHELKNKNKIFRKMAKNS